MGKFADKAKGILDKGSTKQVTSISNFIRESDNTKSQEDVFTDKSISVISNKSDTESRNATITGSTVREEFRLPVAISEKLAAAAFYGKTKKVRIVIDALEKYFEKKLPVETKP